MPVHVTHLRTSWCCTPTILADAPDIVLHYHLVLAGPRNQSEVEWFTSVVTRTATGAVVCWIEILREEPLLKDEATHLLLDVFKENHVTQWYCWADKELMPMLRYHQESWDFFIKQEWCYQWAFNILITSCPWFLSVRIESLSTAKLVFSKVIVTA